MNTRVLPLLGLLLATACKEPPPPPPPPAPPAAARPAPAPATRFLAGPPDGKLHVHFFDVGHGDSALIISPEGRTVLIDTGPASAVTHLINRLPELLAARLDLLVLTHPAPEHYGAVDAVQQVAGPLRLLEPQLPGNSSEYDGLLTAMGTRGVEIFSPAPTPSQPQELQRLPLGGGVELTVLWPRAPSEPLLTVKGAEHEANSIVLRLTYEETSVLFAGDARAETEAALMKHGEELRSTLLKVSGHGAESATSLAFLQEVRPRAAIISVGAENTLGMPATSTLERLRTADARVFRTDKDGEVRAVSDGKRFVLTTQRLAPDEPPNTQHVFEPLGKDVKLAPLITPPKPEVVKIVPSKPSGAKRGTEVDLSHFGKVMEVQPAGSSKAGPARYFASRNSEVFHKPSCYRVRSILPKNLIAFSTREEALRKHKPAKDCAP